MNDTTANWIDYLLVFGAAVAGVVARLGLIFSKRQEDAAAAGTRPRGLTLGETVAAMIAAPALGYVANAIGIAMGWNSDIRAGLAGFAGLIGPAALLVLSERLLEPAIAAWRARWGVKS